MDVKPLPEIPLNEKMCEDMYNKVMGEKEGKSSGKLLEEFDKLYN
jgi:hypothetical protein